MLLALVLLLQDPAVDVAIEDSLVFRARDGSFEGYLGGFIRIHGRWIVDRPDDRSVPLRTLPDGFFLRQARLDLGGRFQELWRYRVAADFATGVYNQSTGDGPSSQSVLLRDAWVEWASHKAFTVRAGQFFVPLSAEELDPGRWLEFAERAPGNRLAPGRSIGLEAYGTLFDEGLRYFAMLYQGNELVQDAGRSRVDDNDEKGFAASVFLQPCPEFRLGLGGTASEVDDAAAAGFDLVSTELSVLYLDSTAGTFDGPRLRGDLNLLFLKGPVSLKAELLWRRDEVADAEDLKSWGAYVQATWLLSGETKSIRRRTVPTRDWGACELAVRAGRLEVENPFDSGLAAGDGNAREITAYSVALTWWYGRRVRLTLNYVREEYSEPLQFDNRREDSLTGVLMRFQLDF